MWQYQQITAFLTKLTLGGPGSQGAVVVNDVVEGERKDEEGAFAGGVHLEGHVPLVHTNCFTFLCQGRLQEFPCHLNETAHTACFGSTHSRFEELHSVKEE